jgi:quinone-modifying oxidoreductase subunit QmoC
MASIPLLAPSPDLREQLEERGAETAGRCYQCATCSAVCELAPEDSPFPRQQMLWAQWGMVDKLVADPSVWLCHQCMDCSVRCPREAKPGEVLQAVRSVVIERLAFPGFLGRLVGSVKTSWPILIGVPTLFWIVLLALTGDLTATHPDAWDYGHVVPHAFIYGVFFPVAAWVMLASWVSGRRFWKLMETSGPERRGSFLANLVPAMVEIATHKRFGSCGAAEPRKLGHLALLWGFVGAAVTSGLLIPYLYQDYIPFALPFAEPYPLAITHPVKILGNVSAALLIIGGAMLVGNRFDPSVAGRTKAFDVFFLSVVCVVIATGMVIQLARLGDALQVGLWTYIIHLGAVLCLFLTFPYSKFAHMLYRTLAMVHHRMTENKG